MTAVSRRIPEVLFGIGLALAVAYLVRKGSGLTFFYDEWDVLLNRDGFSAESFLRDHNGQPFLIPVAVYKLLLAAFGMSSQAPYRAVQLGFVAICLVLLFVYARRRTGPWPALLLTAPVLCLGAAWEVLLLPLSMNFAAGLACGLGMILALERTDLKGDLLACLLLFGAIAAGGLGPAFAVGATLDLCLRKRFRQLWVVAVPLFMLGVWSLAYGGAGADLLSGAALPGIPGHVLESLSAALEAISGLTAAPWLSSVLAVLALLAVATRIKLSRVAVSREAIVLAGTLLAFWILLALVNSDARDPVSSRYQFAGAILTLALIAALLEGLRLPRILAWLCVPLVALAAVNGANSIDRARAFLLQQTLTTRSVLGVLESERGPDLPPLKLNEDLIGTRFMQFVTAEAFFRASDRYGSPAFSPAEIRYTPPASREAAARVQAKIRQLRRAGP